MSPPVWDSSERKRPRYSEDEKSDHRYQCEPQKRTYRHSADSFSRDFKKSPPQNKDYKYRETPQDSRHRYRLKEFESKPRHDGARRRSSASYRERDSREWSRDRSQERSKSQERHKKIPVKSKAIPDSLANSTNHEDCHQTAQLWQNGSSKKVKAHEGDATTQRAQVPVQEQTKGFQRFLAVLNKGVDIDMLTKIVTQSNKDVAPSSASNHVARATDQTQNQRQSRQQSPSPKRSFQYEEEVLEKKTTQTPVDENKCRQMQDVLRAIGIDLGFEELGQMSHRIQERLYGRKDEDLGCGVSRENSSRPSHSPQGRSGSSSSRSSFTPLPRDCLMKQDSHGSQTDTPEVQQAQQGQISEYQLGSGSQEAETCEPASGFTYTPPVLPPAPMMPPYNPSSTLLYPPLSLPPPPVPPHVSPWMVLPQQPPLYPFPTVPSVSSSPAVLGHNSPSFQNLQPLNEAQRANAVQGQRCLQVIETKPG